MVWVVPSSTVIHCAKHAEIRKKHCLLLDDSGSWILKSNPLHRDFVRRTQTTPTFTNLTSSWVFTILSHFQMKKKQETYNVESCQTTVTVDHGEVKERIPFIKKSRGYFVHCVSYRVKGNPLHIYIYIYIYTVCIFAAYVSSQAFINHFKADRSWGYRISPSNHLRDFEHFCQQLPTFLQGRLNRQTAGGDWVRSS